jgi:hypothetical protein
VSVYSSNACPFGPVTFRPLPPFLCLAEGGGYAHKLLFHNWLESLPSPPNPYWRNGDANETAEPVPRSASGLPRQRRLFTSISTYTFTSTECATYTGKGTDTFSVYLAGHAASRWQHAFSRSTHRTLSIILRCDQASKQPARIGKVHGRQESVSPPGA